ncbi:C25 family cysteine peptidase [Dyadobacter sp. CY343]|uniref:putative type IX secretion system sortase PorU2 n=1 Tax=Dyadobacter sp. CY343 TaxID=2907299 RepID=UPI001F478E48|nr:C25 family cysteine peptidase [Dyadobacter sp. CY343]MCE7061890.1 C25 family cysteine peptidase [Dyadobacter sp. CY343]
MHKCVHTILLLLCSCFPLQAQRLFGNEWINYQQQYFRIPIAVTGFYQITAQQMQSAGLPVQDIPANAYQVFRDGKEIAIEVSGPETAPLVENGYIRFFGQKNDGKRDTSLYISSEAMPHSYYSLYSDTTTYFLTWKTDGTAGSRIAKSQARITSDTIAFHRAETLQLYHSHYLPGRFYPEGTHFDGTALSDYDFGEGWTGPEIKEHVTHKISVSVENLTNDPEIELEIMLAGWTSGQHLFKIYLNQNNKQPKKLSDVKFENYSPHKVNSSIARSDLDQDKTLRISIVPVGAGGHISVSYVKLNYLQNSRLEAGEDQRLFYVNTKKRSWKCAGAEHATFYDWTNPDQIKQLFTQNDLIEVNVASNVIGVRKYFSAPIISRVDFQNIDLNNADYLIITHLLMRIPVQGKDPVNAYAEYRASTKGGGFKPAILHINSVFDQFNYGQRGPQGIKNLIAWLRLKGKLKFVLLIGKSIDPQKARKLGNAAQIDMVPNAGWPGSDVALAMNAKSSFPGLTVPVGRISAVHSRQVWDYLHKVKSLEAQPVSAEWRKNIIHLSGGRSRQELTVFKDYVKGFEQKLAGSTLGAKVQTISKESDDPVEHIPLYKSVNEGAALVTLFGHSAPDVTDIDIGYASDDKNNYNNHPTYPAVIINGCAAGSIFYSDKTLSSDWLFSRGKGAVLFLAHTFNGVSSALKKYTDIFYEVLADSAFTSLPFGAIQQEAIKRNMDRAPDIYNSTTIQQMTLHGDPAIRIFPARLPDYALDSSSVTITRPAKAADSLLVNVVIKNNGRHLNQPNTLSIRRLNSENKLIYNRTINFAAVAIADTFQCYLPAKPSFSEQDLFEFTVDEDSLASEENESNNRLIIQYSKIANTSFPDQVPPLLIVHIAGRQLTAGEVINPGALVKIQLFDADAGNMRTDTAGFVIWLKPVCPGCVERRLFLKTARLYNEGNSHFYLEMNLPEDLIPGKYMLTVRARDEQGIYAPDYQIYFSISNQTRINSFAVFPNPSFHAFSFRIVVEGAAAPAHLELTVSDVAGKTVHSILSKPHVGLNELIWLPEKLPAGIYIYKISLSGPPLPFSPEAAGWESGRLLWFP